MCATIVPGDKGEKGNALLQRISTATYEGCRAKSVVIAGFPDFDPVVTELNNMTAENTVRERSAENFKVTTLMPCGSLVIKEQFFKQFLESDVEINGFEELVAKHNATYNKENVRSVDPENAPAEDVTAESQDVKCPILAQEQPLSQEKLNAMNLYLTYSLEKCFRYRFHIIIRP